MSDGGEPPERDSGITRPAMSTKPGYSTHAALAAALLVTVTLSTRPGMRPAGASSRPRQPRAQRPWRNHSMPAGNWGRPNWASAACQLLGQAAQLVQFVHGYDSLFTSWHCAA
jgi:hypothetical protein